MHYHSLIPTLLPLTVSFFSYLVTQVLALHTHTNHAIDLFGELHFLMCVCLSSFPAPPSITISISCKLYNLYPRLRSFMYIPTTNFKTRLDAVWTARAAVSELHLKYVHVTSITAHLSSFNHFFFLLPFHP